MPPPTREDEGWKPLDTLSPPTEIGCDQISVAPSSR
jgi:hypothetical protein